MRNSLSLFAFIFVFSVNSFSAKLVFMVESAGQKQIAHLEGDKSFKNLTQGKSWHLYPDISKDGKSLVFVKGTSQTDLRVTIKDLKTGKEKALSKKGFNLHPKFSNRSSKVFYSSKVDTVQKVAIHDLNTNETTYIEDEFNAYFPSPFQSGETVVYQRNAKQKEIVLFDMLNNKKEVIGLGMSPSLSMDERYIAYTSKKDKNWDINIYDRIEKKTIKVTSHVDMDFSPVFDKDNNLYYTSDRLEKGIFSIYKMSMDSWKNLKMNQEKLVLSKSGTSFYAPRFSGLESYKLKLNPSMIGESRSSFGAITHKGNIYVVGGHQGAEHTYPPESFTSRVTAYNVKTKKWTNLKARINKAHGFQLAARGNYLYAFGGFAYEETNYPKWKSIDVVERYDITKNKWEEIGHMPRRRSSNVAAQVGNLVYLIGGWDATPMSHGDLNGTFHSEVDVYNIEKNTWTTLTTKLPKKRRAFSSFVKDQKIYLVGGISQGGSHFSLLDDFTEFNPVMNSFNELPKLPFATFAPAAGLLNNKAMIIGGMFKTGAWDYEYVPHMYQFDFSKKTWSNTGRFLLEYKGFSQVVKMKNCLGVLGGHSYKNNQDKPVNTFEEICVK